jgi:hypothetical protein
VVRGCVYDASNITVSGNKFVNNGYFKNPTNSDFGELSLSPHATNCFSKNVTPDGTYPSNLQKTEATCTGKTASGNAFGVGLNLYLQTLCDTGFGSCPAGSNYPPRQSVVMQPLPSSKKLATMPNPCLGVPTNAWCVKGKLK